MRILPSMELLFPKLYIVLSSKLHKLPFLSNETLFKLFLKTQLNVDNRSHFKIYPGKTLMRI